MPKKKAKKRRMPRSKDRAQEPTASALSTSVIDVTAAADAPDPRLQGSVEASPVAMGTGKNKAVRIRLDGAIGGLFGTTAEDFISAIESAVRSPAKIIVDANSGGGSVVEAIKIYNYLVQSPAEVEINGVGVMGSAMTVIGQAADNRTLAENAFYMVHEGSSVAAGTVREMQTGVRLLELANDAMARTYAARMGLEKDFIAETYLSGGDHWMNAEEAQANGFIDEIGPVKAGVVPHISPGTEAVQWQVSEIEAETGSLHLTAAIETSKTPAVQAEPKEDAPDADAVFGDDPADYADGVSVEDVLLSAAQSPSGSESSVESEQTSEEAITAEEKDSNMDFEAYLAALGQTEATGDVRDALKAAWAAKFPAEAAASTDEPTATVETVVETVASTEDNPFAKRALILEVLGDDLQYSSLAAEAYAKGYSREQIQLEKTKLDLDAKQKEIEAKVAEFESQAPQAGQLKPRVRYDESPAELRAQLSAAVQMSSGFSAENLEKHCGLSSETINKAMDRFNGIGLTQAMMRIMEANGADLPAYNNSTQMWKAYQEAEMQGRHAANLNASGTGAGWSTLNLPSLAEDLCNREIKTKAALVDSCITSFAEEVEVVDCRERNIIDYQMNGQLAKIAKTGEIEHATMSESRFKASADLYAKMLTIPEKCIINDDLGVFSEIGRNWGELYICSRDVAFFKALLKSYKWTVNKNRLTGVDTEFCPAALDAASDLFYNQRDQSGKPILVSGRHLLASGGSMETKVRRLMTSAELKPANPSDKDQGCDNPWQGYFDQSCYTPWLSHPDVWAAEELSPEKRAKATAPAGAEKIWFVFPDPQRHAAMRITYLQGYRVPRVEFQPTAFNTLGMQSRVVAAYGFDQVCDIGPIMMDPSDALSKAK